MNIIAEDDVSVHEAKRLLEERKKDRDLVYDQKICLEYLEKSATLTAAGTRLTRTGSRDPRDVIDTLQAAQHNQLPVARGR